MKRKLVEVEKQKTIRKTVRIPARRRKMTMNEGLG